jgi:tetratricopeptide (TPR) repeat protein
MARIILCIVSVGLLLTSINAQEPASAKDRLAKALDYVQQQRFAEAVTELDQIIQKDSSFPEAYGLRGSIRHLRQEFDLALADFTKVIELAPNIPGIHQVYNNRSLIRLAKGDFDGALADINKAIAIAPGYAEAYNSRGALRTIAGDLDGALADYNKSISLNPTISRPYEGRGTIRMYRNDLAGALNDFNKAIELNPTHPVPYGGRAVLHYRKGELDAGAHFDRGVIQILRGRVTEGLADLEKGFEIKPFGFDLLLKPPFVNHAIRLDQFISSNPRNARGYQARGIARLLQRKGEEAEKDFQRALSLDPNLKSEIDMLRTKLRRS